MGIRILKILLVIAGSALLLLSCKKPKYSCSKEGLEYSNSTFRCWYSPSNDSVPLGTTITIDASVPRTFVDENTNSTVTNTCVLIHGPLHVLMISPTYQAAIDSFEITADIGKVVKDTIQFTSGQLKGFRTIEWESGTLDSFKVRVKIKTLAKGIYSLALGQQSYKDNDCALYKYFLRPGNPNQHLNYWIDAFGSVSTSVAFNTYCLKVY